MFGESPKVKVCKNRCEMTKELHEGCKMSDKSHDKYRQKLLNRAAEIQASSEISQESRKAVELDQTSVGRVSRIDAIQSQAMALANERNRAAEQQRITSALARIESGEYGLCIICEEEIDPKRLNFDPSLPTCITCASRNK